MRKKIMLTALTITLSLGYGQAQFTNKTVPVNKLTTIAQTPKTTGNVTTPSNSTSTNTINTATSATPQNAPIIKTGVQTVYTVNELTGNNAVKMIASTNYQVSIVFPAKVQSIGINASKQNAVMATIDEYDGRVVYVDALKAGGTATLNFRLLTEGDEYEEKTGEKPAPATFGAESINPDRDPVILKVLIDLTDKDYGVLSYTIKKSKTAPAPAATVAAAPTPAPTPAPVVKTKTPPAPPVRPTSFTGTNSGVTLTVSLTDTAKSQENQALGYKMELSKPADGKTYTLDTALTTLRVRNIPIADLNIPKGQYPITPSAPATGTLEIPKRVQQQTGPKVLMFAIIEKDTATQTEKRRYVGVILK